MEKLEWYKIHEYREVYEYKSLNRYDEHSLLMELDGWEQIECTVVNNKIRAEYRKEI